MKRPAGAFAMGVEVLLGLLIGAAAVAVLVALALSLLMQGELKSERAATGEALATLFASRLPEYPTPQALEETASPSLISGTVDEVLLVPGSASDSLVERGWILSPAGRGMWVALKMPGSGGVPVLLTLGLALLAAGVLLLAALAPAYMSRSVTGPLRAILADVDRYLPGSSALSASASFGDLVRQLTERDRDLARLRAEAESRADEAEERAAAVVASFRSAVLAMDPAGALVLWNPSAEALFGLTPGDARNPFPADRGEACGKLARILESGGGSGFQADTEMELGKRDGRRVLSVSVADSRNGFRAILVTDVTALRNMERRLAEEAAMAGLGAVSAGVAHEMGNTLCALSGFIDLLARGHSDRRTASILAEARLEIESAQRMISSFKGLGSPWEKPGERMSVSSAVESCFRVCSDTGAVCRLDPDPGPWEVVADPVLIQRCLLNLVRNAQEAMPGSPVEVSAAVEGRELVFRVDDRGPGLPAGIDVLGMPFYSTRREDGHMGMGLAISRRIASLMGGSLSAMDRQGGGACFELHLPLADRPRKE